LALATFSKGKRNRSNVTQRSPVKSIAWHAFHNTVKRLDPMWNGLVIVGAFAAIFVVFAKFLDDIGLSEKGKASLQKCFEDWWLSVGYLDRVALALALAAKFSSVTDLYLGPRLFSKRAFLRSSTVAACVLVLFLGLLGIYNGRPLGVAPWEAYRYAANQFEKAWSKEKNGPPTKEQNDQWQAEEELRGLLARYNTIPWAATYSIASLFALVTLNSVLFFLSVVFSRLILREIIAAGRVFSTVMLLIANFALLVPAWLIVLLLVTVLFTPFVWGVIPLTFLLSQLSIYWFLAFFTGGTLAAWAFGGAGLKAITLVGFLPCLFGVAVTGISAITLSNKNLFHGALSWFLLRSAEKGPLKVVMALFAVVVGVVALIQTLRHVWW
jgi:hypothetical protein